MTGSPPITQITFPVAINQGFKNWHRELAENRYDVYLEIQRGGWDSQRAIQKQNPEGRQFSPFASALDLTKVYGAGYVPDDWVTSDLALPAAKEALKRAGRKPEDIDLIILGTTSPDYITPALRWFYSINWARRMQARSMWIARVPHSRHWSPSAPD